MPDRRKHTIHSEFLSFAQRTPDDIVLPNFYYGRFEMDVFKLTKSGYIHEYEIKISRGDYKADFLKNYCPYPYTSRTFKHDQVRLGKVSNKFYFVCPEHMLLIDEVPEYSGLIVQDKYGSFREVKSARLLHKNKVDDQFYKSLSRSMSFRENNLRKKLNFIQAHAK